MTGKLNFQN